jgi:O-antigen ligase
MSPAVTNPTWQPPVARPVDILRTPWFLVTMAMTIVMCLDPIQFTARPEFKQVPLLLMLPVIGHTLLQSRVRLAPLSFPAVCLLLIVLSAAPGLAINKFDRAESSLFSAVSLMIVPLSVYVIPSRWLTLDGKRVLRLLGAVGVCFVIGASVQLFLERRELTYLRIHERAFLVPLVLLVPFYLGRFWLGVAACCAVCTILFTDPRTTLLIVIGMTAGAAYLYTLRGPALRLAMTLAIAGAVIAAVGGPSLLRSLDDRYKGSLGREGNSDFRSYLLDVGLNTFRRSPIYGDFYRGATSFESGSYLPDESGKLVQIVAPLHNDYLEFATKGGVIGAGLLIGGLGGTVVLAWRSMTRLRRAGRRDEANVQAVLCTAVAALMFTILVNPVLNNPVCALPAYLLVSLVWLTDRQYRTISVTP